MSNEQRLLEMEKYCGAMWETHDQSNRAARAVGAISAYFEAMEIADAEDLEAADVFRKEIHTGMTDALRLISETLDVNFVRSLELNELFRSAMQRHRETLASADKSARHRV